MTIIIHHLNDEKLRLPGHRRKYDVRFDKGKPAPLETTPQYTTPRYYDIAWAWGGVVTNKAKRTDDRFALMVAPNGRRIHHLNKSTFQHFFTGAHCKHIKTSILTSEDIEVMCKKLKMATPCQKEQIAIAIGANVPY